MNELAPVAIGVCVGIILAGLVTFVSMYASWRSLRIAARARAVAVRARYER